MKHYTIGAGRPPPLPECGVHPHPDGVPDLQDGSPGVGAREAAARRGVAMVEEVRLQREEEAHFSAHVRGRGRWCGRH